MYGKVEEEKVDCGFSGFPPAAGDSAADGTASGLTDAAGVSAELVSPAFIPVSLTPGAAESVQALNSPAHIMHVLPSSDMRLRIFLRNMI
ncbi:hypothetical protein D3C75_1148680 [compost metagenome]